MKKVLFATTALVLSAGYATAEVAVSGDGRMGVVYDGNDSNFTSRARVKFTLSGSSDSGLDFGGSFRVDHQDGNGAVASAGGAGSVYISGTYGKLTMGDIDSANENANGDLYGVGLTGLGDTNEIQYLGSAGEADDNPGALYEYSFDAVSVYASMFDGQVGGVNGVDTLSVGAKYSTDQFTVGGGYSKSDFGNFDQFTVSGEGNFAGAGVKAIYSRIDIAGVEADQYGLSGKYTFGATEVAAFWRHDETPTMGFDNFGIGASHDLGGGASLVGGVVDSDYNADTIADFGVSFKF